MALKEKGMALGKRGMARRHAKRGWGKHYNMILYTLISYFYHLNVHEMDMFYVDLGFKTILFKKKNIYFFSKRKVKYNACL